MIKDFINTSKTDLSFINFKFLSDYSVVNDIPTSIQSISNNSTKFRIFFNINGSPNGYEKIFVKPVSIYDNFGNQISTIQDNNFFYLKVPNIVNSGIDSYGSEYKFKIQSIYKNNFSSSDGLISLETDDFFIKFVLIWAPKLHPNC